MISCGSGDFVDTFRAARVLHAARVDMMEASSSLEALSELSLLHCRKRTFSDAPPAPPPQVPESPHSKPLPIMYAQACAPPSSDAGPDVFAPRLEYRGGPVPTPAEHKDPLTLISAVAPPASSSHGGASTGTAAAPSLAKRRRTHRATAAARQAAEKDRVQPLFAAIEHGVGFVSATIFDSDRKRVAGHRVNRPPCTPHPRWVEQCPNLVVADVQVAIQCAVAELRASGRSVDAVACMGIVTDASAVVAWDRASGRPLSNAIVAGDHRATSIAAKISLSKDVREVAMKTGQRLDCAAAPACKLRWMLENVSDVRRAQDEGRLMLGTMDSWLL